MEMEIWTIFDYVYEWLLENCNGKKNGRKQKEICAYLGFKPRDFRRITSVLNASPNYDKIISTSGKIYVCDSKEECINSINSTYHQAITLLKKAKQMEHKFGINGQYKITINGSQDFVDTF